MEIASHFDLPSVSPNLLVYSFFISALYRVPTDRIVGAGVTYVELRLRDLQVPILRKEFFYKAASAAFPLLLQFIAAVVSLVGFLGACGVQSFGYITWAAVYLWQAFVLLISILTLLFRGCSERIRKISPTLAYLKGKMWGWGGGGGAAAAGPAVAGVIGGAMPAAGGAIVAGGGGGGAAAAPPGPQAGDFLLLSRAGEWDEVMVTCLITATRWLVYTTSADGSAFISCLISPQHGGMRAPVLNAGAAPPRAAPPGVPAGTVNWMCTPPAAAVVWDPTVGEWNQILADAQLIAGGLLATGEPAGYQVFVPGSVMPLVPLPGLAGAPMGPALGMPAAGVPMAPGAAPVPGLPGPGAMGAALPGAGALAGAGGALGPAVPDGQNIQMRSIADAVEALQLEMAKAASKDKKGSSKKSKDKDKKKKKKKKRKGDSDSSSSRSRSRSSSSSNSSSGDGPLRWKKKGKSKKIKPSALMHLDASKFRKRGDLVAYATKHPGALSAHFLSGIYAKIHKGNMQQSSQLRDVNVAAWASSHTGLTETRDLREVANIAAAMDLIQRDEVSAALDVLSQRVISIQSAKKAGGKWEKAEMIELIPPSGSGLASGGMLSLMGSA